MDDQAWHTGYARRHLVHGEVLREHRCAREGRTDCGCGIAAVIWQILSEGEYRIAEINGFARPESHLGDAFPTDPQPVRRTKVNHAAGARAYFKPRVIPRDPPVIDDDRVDLSAAQCGRARRQVVLVQLAGRQAKREDGFGHGKS